MKSYPSLLSLSSHLEGKIWGGAKLKTLKKIDYSGLDPLGETFEVSTLDGARSLYQGTPLPNEIEVDYLIKFIDTSDYLSVQVHPGDKYASLHENSSGKTECWIILGADEGCGIYLGMKEGVSKESFESALVAGEKMDQFLNFYPVKRGDFYYVPAGSIHAIGKGVTLCEVQQSSGITYRVWDWNRVDAHGKSRELHVSKAMDVLNFDSDFNTSSNFRVKRDLFDCKLKDRIVEHPQFIVDVYSMNKGDEQLILASSLRGHASLVCLEGEVEILRDGESISVSEYNSALILHREDDVTIKALESTKFIWVS